MAGSLGLNKRFAEAVKDLFDEDDWPRIRRSSDFRHAEQKFDKEVKQSFQGQPGEEYLIYFPTSRLADDPGNGVMSNVWTMKMYFCSVLLHVSCQRGETDMEQIGKTCGPFSSQW